MSGIGPQLPPHLAKRKRTPDDDGSDDDDSDGRRNRRAAPSTFGPAPPAQPAESTRPQTKTTYGPTMPPAVNGDEITLDEDGDGDGSDIGPALPATVKSSRPVMGPSRPPANTDEIALGDDDDDDDDSDDDVGPALPQKEPAAPALQPSRPAMGASRGPVMGPTMPPGPDGDGDGRTSPVGPKRRPPVGPSAPPKPGKAVDADSDSDSDSDSDYGPALPGANGGAPPSPAYHDDSDNDSYDGAPRPPAGDPFQTAGPAQRDAWMLAPPTDGGVAARAADPTKIRARKFASGRAANVTDSGGAAASAIGSLWTETVEEKAKRLADTVLGRAPDPRRQQQQRGPSTAAGPSGVSSSFSSSSRRAEREAQIQAYTEATRGRSLYEVHQESMRGDGKDGKRKDRKEKSDRDRRDRRDRKDRDREDRRNRKDGKDRKDKKDKADAEDDPSARAFDRDKDMGLGVHINHQQRRDLVNRASDFGGRFSKGSFL